MHSWGSRGTPYPFMDPDPRDTGSTPPPEPSCPWGPPLCQISTRSVQQFGFLYRTNTHTQTNIALYLVDCCSTFRSFPTFWQNRFVILCLLLKNDCSLIIKSTQKMADSLCLKEIGKWNLIFWFKKPDKHSMQVISAGNYKTSDRCKRSSVRIQASANFILLSAEFSR